MVTIRVDGYLVQGKLETAIKAIVGDDAWRGSEVRVEGCRFRWDMAYEFAGQRAAVEFDGDKHYRHTLRIKNDREKDEVARVRGYRVVRFPYWVQLTTETLRFYFDLVAEIVQDFPHGFITTKAFPASFCELGLERFKRELEALPGGVRDAVVRSLQERAKEYGREYVVPQSMVDLVR